MCVVSMIMDHYDHKWRPYYPGAPIDPEPWKRPWERPYEPVPPLPPIPKPQVTPEDIEDIRRDLEEMKKLIKRAKKYDRENNEPDCESDDKIERLRKIADAVGIDFDEIIKELRDE